MHPVLHFLVALRGFRRAILAVWRDPETKALPPVVGVLLLSGTIFYWSVEDWTLIQSLYFSVVTLTTVGYGDLTPTSDFSRIFTIIYIFIGLGVLVAFLSALAQNYLRKGRDRRPCARASKRPYTRRPAADLTDRGPCSRRLRAPPGRTSDHPSPRSARRARPSNRRT